ncbi:MAG TPA: hypothetical protein VM140_00565 [Burkholderiales bacterium]|nr:hypothetical protein [Burkholderiales bacterium]
MEYAQLNPTDTNIHRTPDEIKEGARARLEETVTAVSEKSREMARYADRRVQENPWTAVGTGFGLGVLFGTLITLLAVRR